MNINEIAWLAGVYQNNSNPDILNNGYSQTRKKEKIQESD